MKVLAICGHNIASIEDFALDLDGDALGQAGLFAITGPTGSGKSTLLDCLCLALYGTTPRLDQVADAARTLRSGHDELTARDPRNLLRRGTAHGWAQVDFLDHQGERRRSRFEVRRGWNKPSGRLQPWSLALLDPHTGEDVSPGTKKETLAAVADAVGLKFAQFRRAAVLAQGEFAAFLQAREDERAELLERLTGTALFAEISRQAYLRAQGEAGDLKALQQDAGGQAPLGPQERRELEQALERADAAASTALAAHGAAQAAVTWHRVRGEREAAVTQAQERLAQASDSLRDLAVGAEHLDRAEHAEPGRGPLMSLETAQALARRARRVEQRGQVDALAHALGWLARASDDLQALEATGARVSGRLATATRWLQDHASVAPRIEAWALWRRCLADLATTSARLSTLDLSLPGLQAGLTAAQQAHDVAVQALEPLTRAATDADQALQQHQAVEADDVGRLGQAVQTKSQDRQALLALAELGEALARRQVALDAEAAAASQAALTAEGLAAARQDAELAHAQTRGARQAAAQALALRQSEAAAAAHRELLRSGEPCPLCGSPEHPWADHPTDEGPVTAQRQALAQAERDEDAAGRQLARARTAADASQATLAAQQARLADEREALVRDTAVWRAALATRGVEPGSVAQARARAQETEVQETALQARLAAAARHQDALTRARAWADRSRLALDQANHDLTSAAGAMAQAAQAIAAAVSEQGRLQQARGGLVAQLDGVLEARWQAGFLADPDTWLAQAEAQVARWQGEQARVEAARRQLAELEGRRGIARSTLERARGAVASAERLAEHSQPPPGPALAGTAETSHRVAGQVISARQARQAADQAVAAAESVLRDTLVTLDLDLETLRADLAERPAWVLETRSRLRTASVQQAQARALLDQALAQQADHLATPAPADDSAQAAAGLSAAQSALQAANQHRGALGQILQTDDARRQALAGLQVQIDAQQAVLDHWRVLEGLIGAADGKKFRRFAQSLTLELLLARANGHLAELAPRYQLTRAQGTDLGLQVIDRDMADEIRSVASLSGGESFLTSLALALGLSSLSARDAQVETLFIDEGLGTLDPETLETALHTLDQLQASGRQIGLISHVPGLAERVGVQVAVRPLGGGLSEVSVLGTG